MIVYLRCSADFSGLQLQNVLVQCWLISLSFSFFSFFSFFCFAASSEWIIRSSWTFSVCQHLTGSPAQVNSQLQGLFQKLLKFINEQIYLLYLFTLFTEKKWFCRFYLKHIFNETENKKLSLSPGLEMMVMKNSSALFHLSSLRSDQEVKVL